MKAVRWFMQQLGRLLREYVAEDGRGSARQPGITLVGAGIIALGIDQAASEWITFVMGGGIALLYYGNTRERRRK